MRILDNLIYRAEKFNEAKTQYKLGIIYLEGDRVEPNLDEAKRWLERAADQGHEEAAKALASLEGKSKELQAQTGDNDLQTEDYDEGTPPIIEPEPREQPVDFGHDLMDGQDCPHGHGPLRQWEGQLQCWVCGWPDEQSDFGNGLAGPPVISKPETTAEEIGRKLGEVFGKSPGESAHPGESGGAKKKNPGCGATAWVVGVILYVLVRSCS